MIEWLARCTCNEVVFRAKGAPIVSAACYCADCRAAGHDLERIEGSPKIVAEDGGTALVLFRKDRIEVIAGADKLREHRLNAETPTRRLVASCCRTAMALDFTKGFWISFYKDRISPSALPLELRVMVKDRPPGVVLPQDVPNYEKHSGRFMLKLIGTWAGMGFRSPKLPSFPVMSR